MLRLPASFARLWLVLAALVALWVAGPAAMAEALKVQAGASAGSPTAGHVVVLREASVGPTPDGPTTPVQLPATWGSVGGERYFHLTLTLAADALSADPDQDPLYGLLVERACNVMQLRVNGHLLAAGGRFAEPVSRSCLQPRLVAVPAALLRPGDNAIDIRVRGFAAEQVTSPERAGALSPVVFARYEALTIPFHDRLLLAERLPEILSGTLLLIGSFLFMLGSADRQRRPTLFFGLLMMGWSLLLGRAWLTSLPWPNMTSEILLATLSAVLTMAAVEFLVRSSGGRWRLLDVLLLLQIGLTAATLLWAAPDRLQRAANVWYVIHSIEALAAIAWQQRRAWRQRDPERMPMLLLILATCIGTAWRTWLVQSPGIGPSTYLAELVPPLAFIAMALRLVQHHGLALQSAEQARSQLEERVQAATAEIQANYEQMAELRVAQVTDRERKRIAGDLHDDLGAKLLTIVHTSDNDRIATLAREALEEMRLSVRGLTGRPMELADALADWRAEVVRRLGQAGIQAEWRAPPDEEAAQTLSARTFVQTTRILREAVSNVIKHSSASRVEIECSIDGPDFRLIIQDNGAGIPLEADGRLDKGHGMASMKGRAKQLHGQCLVESGPGYGTVIRLTVPFEGAHTPAEP